MSLSGKVALITGAAQGLGKAFSEVLLKRGANVSAKDIWSLRVAVHNDFVQCIYSLVSFKGYFFRGIVQIHANINY